MVLKIGNVVYEKELISHYRVDYINYIDKSIEYEDLDTSLPTLYVGWKNFKSSNPLNKNIQGANILDKLIIPNLLYWEFSFDENKSASVNGVNMFVNNVPHYYFKPKYEYVNLDPVFFNQENIDDVVSALPKVIDVSYNYKNLMLYLLKDTTIYGLNLEMFKYFNFDIGSLLKNISKQTNKEHLDLDGLIYEKYHKIMPNYSFLKRYVVSLLTTF